MRAWLIFAFLVSTSAEQHGFSSALAMIQNQMSSLKLNGDSRSAGLAQGRALIINSMLSEFEGATEMSADVRTELNKIQPIIQSIIDDLKQDKKTHDTSIAAVAGLFSGCVDATKKTSDEAAKNQSDKDHSNHTDCRSNLNQAYTDMHGTASSGCQAFWDFVQDHPKDATAGDDDNEMCAWKDLAHTQDNGEDFQKKLTKQRDNWWNHDTTSGDQFMEDYERLRDDCKTKFETLSNKRNDCNEEQSDYEGSYCTWAQKRLERCNEEDECYDKAVEHRHKVIGFVCPAQAQRKEDAAVLKYLICLVNWLVTAENDPKELQKMLDACENELCDTPNIAYYSGTSDVDCDTKSCPKYHDDFGNDMPAQPDQEACVVEDSDFVALFGAAHGPQRDADWVGTTACTPETHGGPTYLCDSNVFDTSPATGYCNLDEDNLAFFGLDYKCSSTIPGDGTWGLWPYQEWDRTAGTVVLVNGVGTTNPNAADHDFSDYFEVKTPESCTITDNRYTRMSHTRSPCGYYGGDIATSCSSR